MKICVLNDKGNVGKTMLTKQLFMPRMSAEVFALDSINRTAGGATSIDIDAFESLILSRDQRNIVIDMGSYGSHLAVQLFNEAPAIHRKIDLFIVPITLRTIADTEGFVSQLLAAGIDPYKILVIVNQLNERNRMMTAAIKQLMKIGIRSPTVDIPDFDFMHLVRNTDSISEFAKQALEATAYFDYRMTLEAEAEKLTADKEIVFARACFRAKNIFDTAFRQINTLINEAVLINKVGA